MVKIEKFSDYSTAVVPEELLKGKRHLTKAEIEILEKNQNYNDDPSWKNFYVDAAEDGFEPSLIQLSFFSGFTQYPTEDVLKRCCIMKDFGEQQTKVEKMWGEVRA